MWSFADDGELYFEKFLGLMRVVIENWERRGAHHSLSIIFFSRTVFVSPSAPSTNSHWKSFA